MTLNLASIVRSSTRYFPDETALIHDERRLSYRELSRHVEAFAAHLRALGVREGDKVALFLPNRMSFTIGYFGILHAGGTVVPVSFLSVAREVAYTLRDSDAVLLIAWGGYEKAARAGFEAAGTARHLILVDESRGPMTVLGGKPIDPDGRTDVALTRPDDTAVLLYTSGTTGEPKGAELTHFNMYSNAQYSAERILWDGRSFETLGPGNVILGALPLFHSFGQTTNQNAAIFAGGALTYLERFEPEAALRVMERDRVTLFSGVPTMYFQLLHFPGAEKYDISSLRHATSGGAAMPVEVLHAFEERYPAKILEGYGLSETSPVATFNVLWKPRKPGSIGEPIHGCDVKIFDDADKELPAGEVGELVIRGMNVMKGYYKKPDATREVFRGGWFHTGDMGKKDEDGYLYIVDRKKDMIIRGGFNVYPREVEEVLYGHPAVREAAVVGVADPQYGEEVKAYVSLKADASGACAESLLAYCRQNLSATKYPRIYEVLPDLPKGPTGKILRKELRARARGDRPAAP
jgi:long-chain acyl-CoA synthetase